MSYTFEQVDNPDWSELDQFEDRTVFQTGPWLSFISEAQGARPVVLRVLDGGRSIGRFSGLLFRKFGLTILGSPFPGWTTSYMGFNLDRGADRVDVARAFIRWSHQEFGVAHVEFMDRRLSVEQASAAGWTFRTFSNFEIDLRPTEDELFSALKGSCRTSIRKSQKEGVTIEIASDAEFADDYYAQLEEVFARQGLKPTYSVERVRLLIKHLLPTGNLLLLRARSTQGECLATGIYPAFNKSMFFWGGASWRRFQILQPNEPLHWFAMMYWKERGMCRCDMGGGGEYKRKYGGYDIAVPWIRASKYPGMELARNLAQRIQSLKQRK